MYAYDNSMHSVETKYVLDRLIKYDVVILDPHKISLDDHSK